MRKAAVVWALVTMLFCSTATVLTGCAASQWAHDHVNTAGGSVSVDPATGAITVSGNVGLKEMEEATEISNAIMARKATKGLKAISYTTTDACGNKKTINTYVPSKSLKSRLLDAFKCPQPQPQSQVIPAAPLPSAGDTPAVPAVAEVLPDADDASILAQVLANNLDDTPRAVGGDRAVVFGNNYPGTDAELNQCVNDAHKVVLHLVKYEHFDPRSIRLLRNQQCTKANYEKWSRWAMVDGTGGRRWWSNSSHGAEDTDAGGKIVQLIVTDDMVRKGVWDASTEVSFDYWYALLRSTNNKWVMLNDSCHSGGQARPLTGPRRTYRSYEGPPQVQARLAAATSRSTAIRDLGTLTGTIFPACRADQLASEGPNGGVGTDYWVKARRKLPVEAKSGDIVREVNRLMRESQETQNMILIGQNSSLWGN